MSVVYRLEGARALTIALMAQVGFAVPTTLRTIVSFSGTPTNTNKRVRSCL